MTIGGDRPDDRRRSASCTATRGRRAAGRARPRARPRALRPRALPTALEILLQAAGARCRSLFLPLRAVRSVLLEWYRAAELSVRPRRRARRARPGDRLPAAHGARERPAVARASTRRLHGPGRRVRDWDDPGRPRAPLLLRDQRRPRRRRAAGERDHALGPERGVRPDRRRRVRPARRRARRARRGGRRGRLLRRSASSACSPRPPASRRSSATRPRSSASRSPTGCGARRRRLDAGARSRAASMPWRAPSSASSGVSGQRSGRSSPSWSGAAPFSFIEPVLSPSPDRLDLVAVEHDRPAGVGGQLGALLLDRLRVRARLLDERRRDAGHGRVGEVPHAGELEHASARGARRRAGAPSIRSRPRSTQPSGRKARWSCSAKSWPGSTSSWNSPP